MEDDLSVGCLPMPDVGQAIRLNQLCLEPDPKIRMAELQLRRTETYAIRDLWKTMQDRRARRHQLESLGLSKYHPKQREECLQPPTPATRLFNSSVHTYPHRIRSTPASEEGSILRHNDSFKSVTEFRQSESAPLRRVRKGRDTLIPYHTAITMPPDRSKTVTSFNALNRKILCHLPNIYDKMPHVPGYTTRDIKEWKNEVRKVVPARPKIFLPANAPTRSLSITMPPETERTNDPACYFRCTVDKMAGKDKEYMINPEWPSEKHSPETVRSRAHCVYVWNV